MDEIMRYISTLVGSIGFPIVCCIFLWKYINETMKSFTENMSENTKMLTRIYERLDQKGLQSLESNPQLSFATRMEDWTCLGQHQRQPEFFIICRFVVIITA